MFLGVDLGGRMQGGFAPSLPHPQDDDLQLSNTTGILQKKKTLWLIGVEENMRPAAF